MAAAGAYVRVSYRVPEGWREEFCADLWTDHFLGLEIAAPSGGFERIDSYYRLEPPQDLERWAARGVETLSRETMDDRDWLEKYRASAVPILLGRRFVVDPREPTASDAASRSMPRGRLCLRLPARRAFGTGSHESTRLAVDILESVELAGLRVIEVGSGSGILAFVCLALGADFVAALDNDPEAVVCSAENARRNRFQPGLVVASPAAVHAPDTFDLAVINILPSCILDQLARVVDWLRPGGELVYSGALVSQKAEIEDRFEALDLEVVDLRRDKDWIALRGRRPRPVDEMAPGQTVAGKTA